MTTSIAPNRSEIAAHPYVEGASRRIKGDPTKLNPLAGKVMVASGVFSTRSKISRAPLGRLLGAVCFLLATGLIALGGDFRFGGEKPVAEARAFQPDELFTLGLAEFREMAPKVDLSLALDGQDQFEIARFFRLSAAKLPASGKERRTPTSRTQNMAARL